MAFPGDGAKILNPLVPLVRALFTAVFSSVCVVRLAAAQIVAVAVMADADLSDVVTLAVPTVSRTFKRRKTSW